MNQDNQLTIQLKDLELIKNESGKVVLNHNAEQFLKDLLELQTKVEETLVVCKQKIQEAMEAEDFELSSINTDNLKIMNRVYGSKYSLDKNVIDYVDKKFYEPVVSFKLLTDEVDKYIKEKGTTPEGITPNLRTKTLSISLKGKKENETI